MPSLILHPDDPCWHPVQTGELRAALQEDGLLAAGCPADLSAACLVGEHFLRLIMFLGCSPQVTLTADASRDGQPLCTVRFNNFDSVRFVGAAPRSPARCPHCRAEVVIEVPRVDEACTCAGCNVSMPVQALDWRQAAGFGRFFIEVSGIYPHEAVPADRLLARLRDFSHCEWKYFFTNRDVTCPKLRSE